LTVLHTGRARLRPVCPDDSAWLRDHWSLPLVRRWLWDNRLPTVEEITAIVEASTRDWKKSGYGFWIIELPDASAVGTVGFRESSWEPEIRELVYSLDPALWGQGLATEVARAVLEWAFATHRWPRIAAATDTPNVASARVLERIGMRLVREGLLEPDLPTRFFEIRNA